MREEQHELRDTMAYDKENIDPNVGVLSPRVRKRDSRRLDVLREITERSKKKEDDESELLILENSEIDELFEKLGDSPTIEKDFREL